MELFGTISDLTKVKWSVDGVLLTLQPNTSTTYTVARTLSLPNNDADDTLAGLGTAQTWTATQTFVAPALGTPASGTLTNCTGLPITGVVNGTANYVAKTNAGGTASEFGLILNANIGAGAAIETSKLADATQIDYLALGGTLTTLGAWTQTGAHTLGITTTANTAITLPTTGTLATTSNKLSDFAATSSIEFIGVISNPTGSGALVFADTPTLVTPILGTPTSGTLTNCTLPVGGISGLGANVAAWLADPTSVKLKAAVTGETGSGALVFAAAPTLSGEVTLSGTVECTGTSHLKLPAGTTGERPGTPTAGDVRYNSDEGKFEGYTDDWGALGGGLTPVELDHTDDTATLEAGNHYIIDMGGAAATITFNMPAGAAENVIAVTVFGVEDQAAYDTTPYYVSIDANGTETFEMAGGTYDDIVVGQNASSIISTWSTTDDWITTAYDLFTPNSFAGDLNLLDDLSVDGFTTLGSGNIAIKTNIVTTAKTAGATLNIPHGVTLSKIRSVCLLMDDDTSSFLVPPNAGGSIEYLYTVGATNIAITARASGVDAATGNAYATITYIE